jgi:hypothetical protein
VRPGAHEKPYATDQEEKNSHRPDAERNHPGHLIERAPSLLRLQAPEGKQEAKPAHSSENLRQIRHGSESGAGKRRTDVLPEAIDPHVV